MTTSTPTPLLLGAALLFWGWETGFMLPAVLLALVVEGSGVLRRRWELTMLDFRRVWDVCVAVTALAAALTLPADITPLVRLLQLLNPNPQAPLPESVTAAYALAQFMPLLFAPIIVAQRYSTSSRLTYDVFFWLIRGKPLLPGQKPGAIGVAYPYFAVCLTATGAANQRNLGFYVGLSLLVVWALWAARPRRFMLLLFLVPLAAAAAAGYVGQFYLNQLQGVVENGMARLMSGVILGKQDSAESRTGLGEVGDMKASGAIVMRVTVPTGQTPPSRLRAASFDVFASRAWFTSDRATTPVPPAPDRSTWVLDDQQPGRASLTIETRFPDQERLLSLPTGAARVEALPATEMTRNRYGAVKAGPGSRYAKFRVRYDANGSADSGPTAADRQVPERESAAVAATLAELRLAPGAPVGEVIAAVTRHFEDSFTYSTYHAADLQEQAGLVTPLANFLQKTHSGHCEYFAAATTLLLRQAGIPARYAVGYAVQEQDRSGALYLVRERHGHAWCLYFAGGRWHELDTTPAGWVDAENADASLFEPLTDFLAALRFRVEAWLDAHPLSRNLLMGVLALLVFFLVWRRLTGKTTTRRDRQSRAADSAGAASAARRESPFHRLEERLAALGYARPDAEPAGPWLRRVWPLLALPPDACEPLLRLHYRDRFDPEGLATAEAEALQAQVNACLEQLRAATRLAGG